MGLLNLGRRLVLVTLFVVGFSACQETEFYEKPELLADAYKKDVQSFNEDDLLEEEPTEPVEPVNPVAPVEPTEPTNPIAPVEPTEPTNPIAPVEPTEPTNPIAPVDPVDPVDPPPVVEEETDTYTLVTENFTQKGTEKSKVDIVWVVDNSGSMGDEQSALAYNFDAFIQDFLKEEVDFQMAITTTDGTDRGDGQAVSGSMEKLTSVAAASSENEFINNFMNMIQVGVRGSGQEMGLHTSKRFLQRYGNWLREDAYLIIVAVSDEEEQGSETVQEYIDFFRSMKNNPGFVKVHSICETRTTKLNNYYSQYTSYSGERYKEASNLTGGLISDIHQNFHTTLTDIGGKIVELLDSFALSAKPTEASSLKVFVNDTELLSGWNYESESNAISFDETALPVDGDKITVEFKVKK